MRKNNNIIEINGQRYDATTGALLSRAEPDQTPTKPRLQPSIAHKAVRPVRPAKHDTVRRPAKQHSSHRPAAPRTLMRHVVTKPQSSLKRQFNAQGHVDAPAKQPLGHLAVKLPVGQLDAERLRHAKKIPKSRLISHFPPFTAGDIIKVRAAHRPTAASTRTPGLIQPTQPAAPPKRHAKTTAELLDHAVQQASSHLELPPKQPRRRQSKAKHRIGIGAAAALSVLVLGVIVTQNLSNLRLQMASSKAGFSASLPTHKPAGYSLGKLNYSAGVVAAQFQSNSDGRHYSVTQKRSAWDSATLRDTFVAPIDAHYQTVQSNDRTIFLYGNYNATWVNGGIWYVIQSDGSLGDRQLIDLATSL